MTLDQLRLLYLDFCRHRSHAIVPSSSLVPENDPTTLFTGSGMQPMVPYLLGETHPAGKRVANSQKCFRSQDIEEVGDNRHTTFFEMLGNWSFGDYFKTEQLKWFFEFLTEHIGLDPSRLYVTVFAGSKKFGIDSDQESVHIWSELFSQVGLEPKERIFAYPEEKNWWSRAGSPEYMPAGEPGGPDSEVFYDFGQEFGFHQNSIWKDQPCHVNCDCGRYLEIGNSVFMQYQKLEDGSFAKLPQQNVDFGGGLERILASKNHQPDVFKTEVFLSAIEVLERESKKSYASDTSTTQSMRVILDHMRASVMLVSDGVYPSNKQQGYFVRRLIRRSVRHAKKLGIFSLSSLLTPIFARQYSQVYPEVLEQSVKIEEIISQEEQKFAKALEKGLKEIEKLDRIDASSAFKLYESFGFPFELSQEIAKEKGFDISLAQFEDAKRQHADASRSASAQSFKGGLADHSEQTTRYHTATHLIHSALREVVGDLVQQKGSHITKERLRFDYLASAISQEQLQKVEDLTNLWIDQDLQVFKTSMQKDKALASGAVGFFAEKYPDQVLVYTIGKDEQQDWVSKELCGGPHVDSTAQIGKIKIYKDKSIADGVRRLYAK